MSRLVQALNKMKQETVRDIERQQAAEIDEFRRFYSTNYYAVFKQNIQDKLNTLDRQPITDPSKLVLVQGERNALMAILDDLNTKERLCNELLRKRAE